MPTLSVPIDGAHLYGAPLGVIAVLLEPLIPADPYVIRHLLIAATGWVGLVLCGMLADRLFAPPHGLLAMALLAVCPRYMADAMNNPKDLPFATVATAVLLALTYMRSRPPFVSARLAVALSLIIGAGLNVRAGALMFIAYLGVVLWFALLQARAAAGDYLRTGLRVTLVVAGALAIGWLAWPWAYGQPLRAPFRAMVELGHFAWGNDVLYAGRMYPAKALPATYVLRWLWLTLPPGLLIGVGLSCLAARNRQAITATVGMWSAVAFPLLYVVGTHATLYDGIRHLLFVLPPLAVLSAAGWLALWSFVRPGLRPVVAVLLAAGVLEPLVVPTPEQPEPGGVLSAAQRRAPSGVCP